MPDDESTNIPWIPDWLAYYAKAFAAGIASGLFTLAGMVSGDDTFSDVTFQQWLLVAGAVLVGWGVTYTTANRVPD